MAVSPLDSCSVSCSLVSLSASFLSAPSVLLVFSPPLVLSAVTPSFVTLHSFGFFLIVSCWRFAATLVVSPACCVDFHRETPHLQACGADFQAFLCQLSCCHRSCTTQGPFFPCSPSRIRAELRCWAVVIRRARRFHRTRSRPRCEPSPIIRHFGIVSHVRSSLSRAAVGRYRLPAPRSSTASRQLVISPRWEPGTSIGKSKQEG